MTSSRTGDMGLAPCALVVISTLSSATAARSASRPVRCLVGRYLAVDPRPRGLGQRVLGAPAVEAGGDARRAHDGVPHGRRCGHRALRLPVAGRGFPQLRRDRLRLLAGERREIAAGHVVQPERELDAATFCRAARASR